jgi:DNA-binding NarL/FixJ family response regulator
MRTIVVEDDTILRRALVDWLETSGMQIVGQAGSAADAIACCLANQPDVVLLDFRLQDSTGLDVSRALRHAGSKSRVVMFSAFGDPSVRRAALHAGVDAFVRKGADPESLLRVLRGGPGDED